MATLAELRNERLRKLADLKKLGVNPYPATSARTNTNQQIIDSFSKLEGKNATVAGRIHSLRKLGKLSFIVIRDASGNLQLFLRDGTVDKPNYEHSELGMSDIGLLDIGDFVEATGPVIKTKTGEISVEVHKLRLLTKSLRPMPSDWHGFSNKEERLRRRYIDTNVNKDVYERFIRRSQFWEANREYLNQNGFVEINTPVLEHTTGGADAKPFKTHMDAIDQDFYLRISHELPLKRLIGGGYEKVYDLGPRFRNENYTEEHLPEHIALEWYWAFADWTEGMEFMTDMFRHVYNKVYGTLKFKIHNHDIDLGKKWEKIDYAEIIKKHYDIDVFKTNLKEVQAQLKKHKLVVEKTDNIPRSIDKLWKNLRKDIAGPAWLVNTPLFISPLAKQNLDRPDTVQRFQPVIGGSELGNGYSELNDPVDQLNRFLEQQSMRDSGDDEAQMLDIDFVEMLEYGMPPTCGWGHSERAFWMFEGVTAREGVPFPQLRSEVDQITRGIYPEVYDSKKSQARGKTLRPQDFSKRIVSVVNKNLESWQATNAVAHMAAIIGNEVDKNNLVSGDEFVAVDGNAIPRNSQYPIVIKKADDKELHKLFAEVKKANLIHHVFIKEMQETTNDEEIVDSLKGKSFDETVFYGVTFFADNDKAEELAKRFQLLK